MKDLKIVIDLKDLYTEQGEYDFDGDYRVTREGESDFNAELKSEIQHQVISRIIKGFTPEVTKNLRDETIDKFKEQFEAKISERIEKGIDRGIFAKPDGSTFNVDTFARERLEQAINSNRHFLESIDKSVKAQIKTMEQGLQNRYDLEFAAGIIKNLKDNNLLKDGAEKMLLKDEA